MDNFYDTVFLVENTIVKANSLLLRVRSPYFAAMLSPSHRFLERNKLSGPPSAMGIHVYHGYQTIKIEDVPRVYFHCIIQYLYSDHFVIHSHSLEFFLRLFVFADYFMVPRLVDICSDYLKNFVNTKTAITLLLYSLAHNASQLQRFLTYFIAQNKHEVQSSEAYKRFSHKAHPSLKEAVKEMIDKECQESYVEIAIRNYQKKECTGNNIEEDYQWEILESAEYIYLQE